MARVALLILAAVVAASSARAQSQPLPAGVTSYAPATVRAPAWEARFGAATANPGGREQGLLNLNAELVTPRVVSLDDRFAAALVPRFHLGSSANFNGTRYAYAGATWTIDLSKSLFVEASLGAAINDGKTGPVLPENRLNVGCNAGTREAAGVGVRLSDRWSLMATLEHFSTTGCSDNTSAGKPRGPANVGARLGYSF